MVGLACGGGDTHIYIFIRWPRYLIMMSCGVCVLNRIYLETGEEVVEVPRPANWPPGARLSPLCILHPLIAIPGPCILYNITAVRLPI